MALLEQSSFARAEEAAMPTNTRKYRVGKKIFENDILIHGSGDYVDKEEAERLDAEHGTNLVQQEVETTNLPELPKVGDNKEAWESYAQSIHGIDTKGMVKQTIIDTVYEKENEETAPEAQDDTETNEVETPDSEPELAPEETYQPGESTVEEQ